MLSLKFHNVLASVNDNKLSKGVFTVTPLFHNSLHEISSSSFQTIAYPPVSTVTELYRFLSSFKQLKNKVIDKDSFQKLPLLILTKGAINRIRLDDYCAINNMIIKPEMEFGSNTLIKEFTMAGFGIGMLTEEHVKEEINNGDLFKLNINFKLKDKYLGLVYNKDNLNLVSKRFIKYIKKNTVDKNQ